MAEQEPVGYTQLEQLQSQVQRYKVTEIEPGLFTFEDTEEFQLDEELVAELIQNAPNPLIAQILTEAVERVRVDLQKEKEWKALPSWRKFMYRVFSQVFGANYY